MNEPIQLFELNYVEGYYSTDH